MKKITSLLLAATTTGCVGALPPPTQGELLAAVQVCDQVADSRARTLCIDAVRAAYDAGQKDATP